MQTPKRITSKPSIRQDPLRNQRASYTKSKSTKMPANEKPWVPHSSIFGESELLIERGPDGVVSVSGPPELVQQLQKEISEYLGLSDSDFSQIDIQVPRK